MSLRQNLDAISQVLRDTFAVEPFKRNYDTVFAQVAAVLRRYGLEENPRNLRFRFILCVRACKSSLTASRRSSGASRTQLLSKNRRSLPSQNSANGSSSR
ncbi:MAG: hypothetical protein AB1753_02250 [Thermoproteota archaeon]